MGWKTVEQSRKVVARRKVGVVAAWRAVAIAWVEVSVVDGKGHEGQATYG